MTSKNVSRDQVITLSRFARTSGMLVMRMGAMITDRIYLFAGWIVLKLMMSAYVIAVKVTFGKEPSIVIPDIHIGNIWPMWWKLRWSWALPLAWAYGISLLTAIAIGIYVAVTIVKYNATPGMRAWNLEISRVNNESVTWPRIVLWYLVSIVSGYCLYIGYLWALLDKQGRTWHDIAAGLVVSRRSD